ncbi:MAG: SDR family NAD(P)-dependent oxidoreductase, partial [Oscillospiraceae bacterium]|nr:SDR family NAD(P)-dependent oxidoreductase [Oscillospiraceae bacterium]
MKHTVIITGATSGIGYATCEALLEQGYPVIGIGRSPERCKSAKESLEAGCPGTKVHFITADLMQQREVLRAAREVEGILPRLNQGKLHALINNAG